MTKPLKPSFLFTDTHRNVLEGRAGATRSEIAATLATITQMSSLYDGLAAAAQSQSPHETPQARAMRVEQQFNSAGAKVKRIATEGFHRLETLTKCLETNAIEESGLGNASMNAAEIRAALRSMKPAEREKAIEAAFEAKDTEVLAAIYKQNPILWGGSTGALDVKFKMHIHDAAPQAMAEMETVSKALASLEMATSAFIEGSNELRQPTLAEEGRKQQEEHERAQAALTAALKD
jgi:hypothetical protein